MPFRGTRWKFVAPIRSGKRCKDYGPATIVKKGRGCVLLGHKKTMHRGGGQWVNRVERGRRAAGVVFRLGEKGRLALRCHKLVPKRWGGGVKTSNQCWRAGAGGEVGRFKKPAKAFAGGRR